MWTLITCIKRQCSAWRWYHKLSDTVLFDVRAKHYVAVFCFVLFNVDATYQVKVFSFTLVQRIKWQCSFFYWYRAIPFTVLLNKMTAAIIYRIQSNLNVYFCFFINFNVVFVTKFPSPKFTVCCRCSEWNGVLNFCINPAYFTFLSFNISWLIHVLIHRVKSKICWGYQQSIYFVLIMYLYHNIYLKYAKFKFWP